GSARCAVHRACEVPRPGAAGTVPACAWMRAWVARWSWTWGVRLLRGLVAAAGVHPHPAGRARRRAGSGGGVVRAQRAVGAQEPFARLRLELRTAFHRRLVDMQRDRDLVAAGVGDGVVLVRRDQAACAAGAGVHATGGAEAEALAVAFEHFVLGDFQFPVPDALHAP